MLIDVGVGFLIDPKKKADIKLTVEKWCHIFDGKSSHLAALYAGNHSRGRRVDKIRNFEEKKLYSKLLVRQLRAAAAGLWHPAP